MKVGIVGFGHVGTAMQELFKDAYVYDKYKKIGSKREINKCDVAFVCVPTPQNEDGSCDTSMVDEVLNWLKTDLIVIRSTVPVGYTKEKNATHKSSIVFQPEYYGETIDHPLKDLRQRKWITLGGEDEDVEKAVQVYQTVYNANIKICLIDSSAAELAKYMENAYFAMKVIFCNEFYDIAKKMGISYSKAREAWTLDPRINKDHTFVYAKERGYGKSCLPKDLANIIYQAEKEGIDVTLLKSIKEKNAKYRPTIK